MARKKSAASGSAFAPVRLFGAREEHADADHEDEPGEVLDWQGVTPPEVEVDKWREAVKRDAKRQLNRYDSEHWIAVSFIDRDEADDFLREFGLSALGDKYLDGAQVARALRAWRDRARR